MDGYLCLPGGHVHPVEPPRHGAAREIQEELGTLIAAERLQFLCVYVRLLPKGKELENVAYQFHLELLEDEMPINTEPYRCSEIVWLKSHQLPEEIIPESKEVIARSFIGKVQNFEVGHDS